MFHREAAFDAWLHDRGYTYVGPNSLYRLTLPEMMRLHIGWEYRQRQKSDGQAVADANARGMDLKQTQTNEVGGVGANAHQSQHARQAQQTAAGMGAKARARAANPHRKTPGQPRESDIELLERMDNRASGSGGDR